ncbi:MAG: hypothetical protein KatS3mg117_0771 [Geminicoccaceae bacterium]|nr:MAG: hypothetical protein KatS3mg117_0771 [Geminicoccaceae bacterium]
MRARVRALFGVLLLVISGCTGTQSQLAPDLAIGQPGEAAVPFPDDKVPVLPPDLEVGEATLDSEFTPRADRTEEARRHVIAALEAKLSERVRFERLDEASLDPAEKADYERLVSLLRAVAKSISPDRGRPTSRGWLDWSVGDTGKPLAKSRGARYALFLRIRDTHASTGLVLANLAVFTLAIVTAPHGGQSGWLAPMMRVGEHFGTADLVDLETGRILWHNRMRSASLEADLRTRKGAEAAIEALLEDVPIR